MRPVLIGDLIALARCLCLLPGSGRAQKIRQVFAQAQTADKVMKRLHRPHHDWGNGSLMAALGVAPKAPEPFLSDLDFLNAFAEVVAFQQKRLAKHCRKEK